MNDISPSAVAELERTKSPGLLLATGLLLAACAAGEHDGYTQIRADASPHPEAHTECWAEAYALLGGIPMDMKRADQFDTCMARGGWRDQRTLLGGSLPLPKIAVATSGKPTRLDECRAAALARSVSGGRLHEDLEACMSAAGEPKTAAGTSF